jgi:Protein of unknown function (DUF3551)
MARTVSFAIFVSLSTFAAAGSMSPAAAAPARQDTYCLQGRQSGYPGNCEFSSFQQCQATASGTGEGCGINPMRASQPRLRGYRGQF